MNLNSENYNVNITQNSIDINSNQINSLQSVSFQRYYKNAIFYILVSIISIAFLSFSRDLVIKYNQNQINQNMRILEEYEIDNENNIFKILQHEDDNKANNSKNKFLQIKEFNHSEILQKNLQKTEENEMNFNKLNRISDETAQTPIILINSTLVNTITEELDKISDNKSSQEILEINEFFNDLNFLTYSGKWIALNNKNLFQNDSTGDMLMRMEKKFDKSYNSRTTLYGLKLLKGKYIDEWISFKGLSRSYNNITIKNESISIYYSSFSESGNIFERTSEIPYCKGEFFILFSKKILNEQEKIQLKINKEEYIDKINGTFKSTCGEVEIRFELEYNDDSETYRKVTFYSFILTIFVSMQIMNNVHLHNKIGDSATLSNSISLITIGQSIIWNSYGCLCHFFLTINFEIYFYHFGIPTFLFFINFTIFELRLIYTVWKNQNMRYLTNAQVIRKRLLRFYFTFYFFMFLSLFFVMKFYFDKVYILIAIFLTWTPQIIYNAYYRNNFSMPLISIMMFSINRIFLPFYYRGCPDNFFRISHDYSFVCLAFLLLCLSVLFLYLQSIKNPRWFLPERLKGKTLNFYKTKNEILFSRPDAEFFECSICLLNLFHIENSKSGDDDFMSFGVIRKTLKEKFFEFYRNYKTNLFDFHIAGKNVEKTPFMQTPCSHFFHTVCLESWLNQKKDCPCCRKEIEEFQ